MLSFRSTFPIECPLSNCPSKSKAGALTVPSELTNTVPSSTSETSLRLFATSCLRREVWDRRTHRDDGLDIRQLHNASQKEQGQQELGLKNEYSREGHNREHHT